MLSLSTKSANKEVMTRAGRPTYLGGIGLMLEVAHICPRCGRRVSDTPGAAAQHLSKNRCRPTVFAALPEPDQFLDEEEVPRLSAARQIQEFETPTPKAHRASPRGQVDALGSVSPTPGGSRGLAIPWLTPPDLGEVL